MARRLRRPWALAAAAVALAGLAGGLGWWWAREPTPQAEVVGGNSPINAGAGDRLDPQAHNSPTVVANPTDRDKLAVTSRVDAPRFGCALHVSDDGGASWQPTDIPEPPGAGEPACFAPSATYGAGGRLYVAYTSFAEVPAEGVVPNAVWVAVSDDGGHTLSEPIEAGGPLAFHVRVAADPTTPGRVYLTWLQTDGASGFGPTSAGNPIVAARSDDAGRTWTEPVEVSPPERQRVITPVPAVGAQGRLHLAYLDVGDDRLDYHGAHEGQGGAPHPGPWELVVATSGDHGDSWRERVVANDLIPVDRFLMLFPPAPTIATDPTRGRVYVAFHDARHSPGDVWLWASPDHADTWREPVRVTDAPAADDSRQHLPAVATAANGRVDVVYYDRRTDPGGTMTEVTWQSSFDGAKTFTSPVTVSTTRFDAAIGYGADRGLPQLGDRLGLTATNHGALAAWADTRADEPATGKQDLASALLSVSGPAPLQPALAGWQLAVLAVAGLAALGALTAAVLAGRRPPTQDRQTERAEVGS